MSGEYFIGSEPYFEIPLDARRADKIDFLCDVRTLFKDARAEHFAHEIPICLRKLDVVSVTKSRMILRNKTSRRNDMQYCV